MSFSTRAASDAVQARMALTTHLLRGMNRIARGSAPTRARNLRRSELVSALELHSPLVSAHLHGEIEELAAHGLAGAAHDVEFVVTGRRLKQEGVLAVAEDAILRDGIGPDGWRFLAAPAAVLHQVRVGASLGLQAVLGLPAKARLLGKPAVRRHAREAIPDRRTGQCPGQKGGAPRKRFVQPPGTRR